MKSLSAYVYPYKFYSKQLYKQTIHARMELNDVVRELMIELQATVMDSLSEGGNDSLND